MGERIGNVLMRVNLKRALFCIVTVHLIGVIHGGGKDFCTSDPAVAVRVFVVPLSYSHGDDSGAIFSQDAILDSLAETMNSTAGTRYRFTWEDTLAFKHWFERAGEKRKHNIQRLVRAGHFE